MLWQRDEYPAIVVERVLVVPPVVEEVRQAPVHVGVGRVGGDRPLVPDLGAGPVAAGRVDEPQVAHRLDVAGCEIERLVETPLGLLEVPVAERQAADRAEYPVLPRLRGQRGEVLSLRRVVVAAPHGGERQQVPGGHVLRCDRDRLAE